MLKPKYKIDDKVKVKMEDFILSAVVTVNGIIESIDETTENEEPEYVIYVPAIDDVLCAHESDIILISEGSNE